MRDVCSGHHAQSEGGWRCTATNPMQRLTEQRPWRCYTRRTDTLRQGSNDQNDTVNVSEAMKENEYARNLFLNSYKYRKSIMRQNTAHAHVTNEKATELLKQDWTSKTDYELLSAVKMLSYNIRYSDERIDSLLYENVFTTSRERHQKLSDENLMTLMRHLVPFREHFAQHIFYKQFCRQLNLECVKRFMNLPIDRMLMLCDMLHEMTYTRDSEYIWHSMRKIGNKPGRLEPHHLVQVLFFLNVCRKPPVNTYELEYRLQQCFDDLSINEIGIAALGFFKTGSQIRSTDLLRSIMKKTITNINDIDNISIGAIAKLIRYSMQLTEINLLKKLIDVTMSIEFRLTLMTLNHIAHASTRVALYHEELFNKIIKRVNNELTSARIKDLERLIFFCTSFNIDSSNKIYHNVIEELRDSWYTRRAYEIDQYPHMFSRILGYLSLVNIYPKDLIERIMMPSYIHKLVSRKYYHVSREFFVLNNSLRVEVPDYNGPFLQPSLHNYLLKKYFLNLQSPESSKGNMLLMHVLQTCQDMFNNTSDIMLFQPLPHFMISNIIICLDEQNQLVPVKDYLAKFETGEIKWVDKNQENIRWIALIMGHHGVLIKDTNLPVGLLAAKMRQLVKIGYIPVVVSYIEWKKCETQEQRHDYMRQLLFQNKAVNSITM
ncbi:uncharacterized protein LOC105183367 isoform X2 [Harpegnathos saltator]|uniref:uncharacterized protein LOC105183367 isoform X2 n=1 Tax=Harpegnathos saltator TaxID=610380 RepID=UPI000DBEDD19|nr:uncharacterized protein LOC105183367 isoform X2 [Harpegnathos saltator]